MNYFSMFSGIGGFEIGISNAMEQRGRGQEESNVAADSTHPVSQSNKRQYATCVGYSEIDKYAIKVYERNFKHENYGDATKINERELPDFDLLVGGFPCQAFSIAGKRQGFNETRGTLFFDIARILKYKRPRHLVLENVKGLLSHDSGKTFQTILKVLTDLGYSVEWQVLNAKDFGVPQNRERIFIVGHLGGECGRKVFPFRQSSSENVEQKPIAHTINSSDWRGANRNQKQTTIRTDNPSTPERGDKPNSTNGIRRASYTDGARIRRLTPLECERLMAYPDNWTKYGVGDELISDTQRYKMCGNGIVSNVVSEVVGGLIDVGCL